MEKVNEVGRFKQRAKYCTYSSDDYKCFDLNLDLSYSYRFDYVIHKENLEMFLNYIGYLTIPELGIDDCKVKVIKYGIKHNNEKLLCCIFLTISGKKEVVDNTHTILNHLCVELKEVKGELNEQSVH